MHRPHSPETTSDDRSCGRGFSCRDSCTPDDALQLPASARSEAAAPISRQGSDPVSTADRMLVRDTKNRPGLCSGSLPRSGAGSPTDKMFLSIRPRRRSMSGCSFCQIPVAYPRFRPVGPVVSPPHGDHLQGSHDGPLSTSVACQGWARAEQRELPPESH